MSKESADYKLTYFNTRGLAEPIRMILTIGKATFDEVRFPKTDLWPYLPPDIKATLPWGVCPVLELKDGRVLSQSVTIARFLAKRFNLAGNDEFEEAKCGEVVDTALQFFNSSLFAYFEKDPEKRPLAIIEVTKTLKNWLHLFNKNLKGNWFVGDSFSYADIYVAYTITQLQQVFNIDLLEDDENNDFSKLRKLVKDVYDVPGIQQWVQNGPPTEI